MGKENDGLRNRRPTSVAKDDHTEKDTDASGDNKDADRLHNTTKSNLPHKVIAILKWILHLAAIACFVAGIILRSSQLHNGDECDMTYSWRIFLKVDAAFADSKTIPSPATSSYALYKFVDQRDPRYSQLWKKQKTNPLPLSREEHCVSSSGTIVVYVPGHWGTYDQARSLGAHGTQMTRARGSTWNAQQKLSSVTTNTAHNSTDDFIYDVYAVDFAEQGGALHGQFLQYQADYLAAVLEQLSEDCGTRKIMVVAHSMGGYVARKVLQEHPKLQVDNLITLATPHSNPLYSFDRSVADFHRGLDYESFDDNKQPLVVSISGGLRDEMIEPSVCEISPKSRESIPVASWLFGKAIETKTKVANSWTILATRLLAKAPKIKSTSSGLGMDHRAIVWCHQVLEEVRQVLFVLVTSSENTVQERLEKVRGALEPRSDTLDYTKDLHTMKMRLSDRFGSFLAICMEASMIYNLPYLLALYATLVAFHLARRSSSMFAVRATIVLGWAFRSDLGMMATVILVLVANSFNLIANRLLPVGFLVRSSVGQNTPLRVLRRALVTILVLILSFVVLAIIALYFLHDGANAFVTIDKCFDVVASTLYVYTIASIYVALVVWAGIIDKNTSAYDELSFDVQLITLLMLTVPFLVAGPIYLMLWEQGTRASSWMTLLSMQVPIGLLASIRLSQMGSSRINADKKSIQAAKMTRTLLMRSISIYLCLFFLCCRDPGLLSKGTGYLVPILAMLLVWIELGHSLFV